MATIARVMVGSATVYYGPAGARATTALGYTEDGVTVQIDTDLTDIDVDELTVSVDRVIVKERLQITLNMAESALANLDTAIPGSSLAVATITLGGGTMHNIAIAVEGSAPGGAAREIFVPYCNSTATVGMAYKRGEKTVVPITVEAYRVTSYDPMQISDLWDKTIAAGVFAHVDAEQSYRLDTEAAAAYDDLDDITGGSDLDVAYLRMKDPDHTIIVKHVIGVIELAHLADFCLVNLQDRLVLTYDFANTTWDETSKVERFWDRTIAAGVITHDGTQNSYCVDTQGGIASDDLDDITTGLVDGDIIRISIKNAARAVVVKHVLGVIELVGLADFTMDNVLDRLYLQYDLAGTTWDEIDRYDA